MSNEISFRQFYETHLQEKAVALDKRKLGAIVAGFFCRIYIVLFFTVITSLMLGFINMFFADGFDGGMALIKYFFQGFFVLVLSIIIIGHARKKIKEDLVPKYPGFFKIENSVLIATLVFWAIVMVGGWFIGTTFLGNEFNSTFFIKWGSSILSMVILVIPFKIAEGIENRFVADYKRTLLPEIVRFTGSAVEYDIDRYIDRKDFELSNLFPAETIVSYTGSDLIKGISDKTPYEISQLKVMEKQVRRSGGKTETKVTDLFNGIFYKADFNKNFSGETFVVPDVARELFGSYLGELLNKKAGGLNRKEVELVYMEDVEFEKEFAVFSSGQQQARYILSPSLMQKITSLKKKFHNEMYLAFRNDHLYIGIESMSDFFEPNLFGDIADYETIEGHFLLMRTLFEIADELGLNTRIWTKN